VILLGFAALAHLVYRRIGDRFFPELHHCILFA